MDQKISGDILARGDVIAQGRSNSLQTMHQHIFEVECFDKHGNFKWRDTIKNLVVNEGLDEILDKFYKGSSYTAAHYVGLTDGTPSPSATDTAALIGDTSLGWDEVTAYDQANRPTLQLGSVSGQSVDNSGNKAEFTISANSTTIGGAFIITNNTKGGTTGVLIGVGAFTAGDKTLDDDDTLNVTVTCTASAS